MKTPRRFSIMWKLVLFAVALALAFQWDQWAADQLAKPISSGQTKAVLRAMRCWGEGATLVVLSAGILLVQRNRWKEMGAVMIAVLVCAGTVDLIKPWFSRLRPNQVLEIRAGSAEPDPNGWNSSFPSGHTATAFSFASGLTTLYPPLRPVCLFAAGGTALSRMFDQRHWLSDCVAGAALGWFLAGFLVRRLLVLFKAKQDGEEDFPTADDEPAILELSLPGSTKTHQLPA
jgi:membrane-associated phospholipid phosphatase